MTATGREHRGTARGWGDLAKRVGTGFRDERSSVTAAGVAYYSFLSLVPALGATVSIYGLFVDSGEVGAHVRRALAVLPDDAQQLVVSQLSRIVDKPAGTLGVSTAVAVVVALASASKGFVHLLDAIGVAYGRDARPRFARRWAVALACTVGALAVGATAVAAFAVLPDHVPGGAIRWLVHLALWIGLSVVGLVGLAILYRLGAGGDEPRWTWVAPGSAVALALLVLVTAGLNVYIANFGSYNATYGALAGVIVLLLWLHLAALIVIVGAQVNADLDHPVRSPTT